MPARVETVPTEAPERLLLDKHAAAALLGIGVSTLWRYVSLGWVPRPVRIGNAVRWRKDLLLEWINDGCPRPEGRY